MFRSHSLCHRATGSRRFETPSYFTAKQLTQFRNDLFIRWKAIRIKLAVDKFSTDLHIENSALTNDIDDKLQRGEVDDKLLKDLGWTKDDLKQFSQRMRKQLNKTEEAGDPDSVQRQKEFKEMLRSLDLKPRRNDRVGTKKADRITDGVNTRRSTPPSDLREAYEAYQRSVSKARRKKK